MARAEHHAAVRTEQTNARKPVLRTGRDDSASSLLVVQRTAGNQAAAGLARRGRPAASRLVVGAADDRAEIEADSVASRVVAEIHRTHDRPAEQTSAAPLRTSAPAVIRRTALTADGVLKAVDSIGFMKKKLKTDLRGETMRAHLDKALHEFESMKGPAATAEQEAVMISMAINSVARIIAEELYDPDIQPRLAAALLDAYRPEIEKKVAAKRSKGDKAQTTKALDLASVLSADDPVTLYMHGEARLEKAAARIAAMARLAGMRTKQAVTPTSIFTSLSARFEAEMASYTKTQLKEREASTRWADKDTYNIKESTGEVSVKWFTELFGDVEQAKKTTAGSGLEFTAKAAAKLKALGDEVDRVEKASTDTKVKPDAKSGDVSAPATRGGVAMSDRQEQHLSEIEARERLAGTGSVEDDIVKTFITLFTLEEAAARAMLATVKTWMATMPITITVDADRWFGRAGDEPSVAKKTTSFRPATSWKKEVSAEKLFDKKGATGSIEYAGEYTDEKYAEERGPNYLRFRAWKDRLMTSLLGFTASEMPTFGAANVNWNEAKGSTGFEDASYGKGYYGNMHFLLEDSVRSRLVYTATDHGPPRRNPLLALHDFCMGGSLTGLKDVKRHNSVIEIVAAATNPMPIGDDLPFEVQIFGAIDISKHVQKIFVKSGVSQTVLDNLLAFKTATAVPYELLSAPPKGTRVMMKPTEAKNALRKAQLSTASKNALTTDLSGEGAHFQALRALGMDVKTAGDKKTCKALVVGAREEFGRMKKDIDPSAIPAIAASVADLDRLERDLDALVI